MILKTQRNMLFSISTLCLCLFLTPQVFATQEITVYEEPDMTYCSWYAKTQLIALTGLPQTTEITTTENAIVQGDAISLIDQGLDNNILYGIELLPENPQEYTLLDFYMYTPHRDDSLRVFDWYMQGHRAVLLFLHDTRRIYDPVKIATPYRQDFETYRTQYITSSVYAYFLETPYGVKEEKKDIVDALFVPAEQGGDQEHFVAPGISKRSATLFHGVVQPLNPQQEFPTHYILNSTIVFESSSGHPVYLLSGTQFSTRSLHPFSFDLVKRSESYGFILPGRDLTIMHPEIEVFPQRLPLIPSINKTSP